MLLCVLIWYLIFIVVILLLFLSIRKFHVLKLKLFFFSGTFDLNMAFVSKVKFGNSQIENLVSLNIRYAPMSAERWTVFVEFFWKFYRNAKLYKNRIAEWWQRKKTNYCFSNNFFIWNHFIRSIYTYIISALQN